jgi:hypothetical protein
MQAEEGERCPLKATVPAVPTKSTITWRSTARAIQFTRQRRESK